MCHINIIHGKNISKHDLLLQLQFCPDTFFFALGSKLILNKTLLQGLKTLTILPCVGNGLQNKTGDNNLKIKQTQEQRIGNWTKKRDTRKVNQSMNKQSPQKQNQCSSVER